MLLFWSPTACTINYPPLQETLECVAYWLNSHPKEVVILACSHFEGMDDECHELFISCLKKLFGPKLCPRKVGSLLLQVMYTPNTKHGLTLWTLSSAQEPVLSLRSLWASGYQVILSYDSQLVARHPQLWPAIPYWWANKDTAQEVIRYLDWNKDMGRPGELVHTMERSLHFLHFTMSKCFVFFTN